MNQAQKTKLFSEMYGQYYPRLLRNMPKFTFDYEEREDIAQETFQRVWQAIAADQYKETAHPFTWIFKIAIGTSQRVLQNKQRQVPTSYEDIYDLTEVEHPEESDPEDEGIFTVDPKELHSLADWNTPESILTREQGESELDNRVQALPEHYREVMALHYYDGLSYEEIAYQLGKDVKYVDNICMRAREKLKTFLGENHDSESERSEEGSPANEYCGGEGGVR